MMPPASLDPSALRVASVPAAHPYIAHLELEAAGVIVLSDPPPRGSVDGRWWPPVMLGERWISAHADAFDLMHLHFGSEALSTGELTNVLDALRSARRPLVFTVHDICHPQLSDQRRHEEHLALLMARADEIMTLTRGAADEIGRRWGRRAEVVPHPHMYGLATPFPQTPRHDQPVVGVDLRDLRPNIDALGTIRTLIAAVRRLRSGGKEIRIRVGLRDRVRDAVARERLRMLCAPFVWVELIEGPRPGDDDLARSLCELDATVLPYRHGTHSGWLELSWDLAVPIIAPAIGQFADQHADSDHLWSYAPGDVQGLAQSVAAAVKHMPLPAGSPERGTLQQARRQARIADRSRIRTAHLRTYRRALAAGPVRRSASAPSRSLSRRMPPT